ncbi:uncharacterized protein LOC143458602 [Clavelina lepadiformis]|uniref:uncharacterized protein LOC143458602 n=1 Tax=Clavelina lepadiformis TaxID=159417 RepID=UPI0040428213
MTRFMSIAEQMSRILQRTAISTNIKERLDFPCALFGLKDGLVFNAPHIPGHLGAMQDAVQYQMRAIEINEGDCILSIHPCAGGVNLPDLTMRNPPGLRVHIELRVGSGFSLLGAHPTPRRGRGQKCAARRLHDNGRRTPRVGQDGRRINDQSSPGDRLVGEKRDVRFQRDIPHGDKQVERAESDQQVCHHLLFYCLKCMVGYDVIVDSDIRSSSRTSSFSRALAESDVIGAGMGF